MCMITGLVGDVVARRHKHTATVVPQFIAPIVESILSILAKAFRIASSMLIDGFPLTSRSSCVCRCDCTNSTAVLPPCPATIATAGFIRGRPPVRHWPSRRRAAIPEDGRDAARAVPHV